MCVLHVRVCLSPSLAPPCTPFPRTQDPDEEVDHHMVLKTGLLSGRLGSIATRSTIRISGIAIDGGRLFDARGLKDFYVRANLVTKDTSIKGMTEEVCNDPPAAPWETLPVACGGDPPAEDS